MSKIITRLKGGIGNQLFCYSAARRLALVNKAELVLDDVTGFADDHQYRRKCALNHFHISARKAAPAERLEPFARYRRRGMKWLSRRKPFAERRFLEQEGTDFDERLLDLKVKGTLYLDGYWQSEGYFKDVEQTIREDLRIIPPTDSLNHRMAEEIRNNNAVALHVRWFDSPDSTTPRNVSFDYYQRAIDLMERKIETPQYILFSDDPEEARLKFILPKDRVTVVSHNRGDENAYADLWLMTQCKHFIITNSTFSWWGAWLAINSSKTIIAPDVETNTNKISKFFAQIPNSWTEL